MQVHSKVSSAPLSDGVSAFSLKKACSADYEKRSATISSDSSCTTSYTAKTYSTSSSDASSSYASTASSDDSSAFSSTASSTKCNQCNPCSAISSDSSYTTSNFSTAASASSSEDASSVTSSAEAGGCWRAAYSTHSDDSSNTYLYSVNSNPRSDSNQHSDCSATTSSSKTPSNFLFAKKRFVGKSENSVSSTKSKTFVQAFRSFISRILQGLPFVPNSEKEIIEPSKTRKVQPRKEAEVILHKSEKGKKEARKARKIKPREEIESASKDDEQSQRNFQYEHDMKDELLARYLSDVRNVRLYEDTGEPYQPSQTQEITCIIPGRIFARKPTKQVYPRNMVL